MSTNKLNMSLESRQLSGAGQRRQTDRAHHGYNIVSLRDERLSVLQGMFVGGANVDNVRLGSDQR